MLAKRRRLVAREVESVLKNGRSARSGGLTAKNVANKDHFAVSVVVPKATAKKAVDRNRMRRAVYRVISSIPLPDSGSMVIMVRKALPKGPDAQKSLIQDVVGLYEQFRIH